MHPIQSHILKQLLLTSAARYSELKPRGVESNRFVYHLRKLSEQGMVTKEKLSYHLTARGKRYVDTLSLKIFQPRFQPKIVTVIICQNKQGEYLCIRRKREPFFGKLAFPYGKIHFGESVAQAGVRELKEKTGLTADLRHCGDVYLSIRERGEIVAHMLCHIFYGKEPTGNLIQARTHDVHWNAIDSSALKEFIPGFIQINTLRLSSKSTFFREMVV